MYECQQCGKCFDKKREMVRHKANKNGCISEELEFSKGTIYCKYCQKTFSTHRSLKRHITNPNSVCFFKDELKGMIGPNIGQLVINNNQTINQTNNQLIQIVPSGKEYIGHITRPRLLELLDTNFDNVLKELMRLIYFSKEAPQNQRWCIMYPKEEFGSLEYNNETNTVEKKSTDQVINKQFDNMMDLMSPLINEIMTENELGKLPLTPAQERNCDMFYQLYGTTDLYEDYPRYFKSILMMAYNYQHEPLESWTKNNVKGKYKQITAN